MSAMGTSLPFSFGSLTVCPGPLLLPELCGNVGQKAHDVKIRKCSDLIQERLEVSLVLHEATRAKRPYPSVLSPTGIGHP